MAFWKIADVVSFKILFCCRELLPVFIQLLKTFLKLSCTTSGSEIL
jgi:hypothetical protein